MGKLHKEIRDELTLYVKQLAWLHAAPKVGGSEGRQSRMEKMRKNGVEPDFPPLSAPFLLGYFNDIGPVVSGDMGRRSIHWVDIVAWQECVGFALPPWQARLIRSASREYLAMLSEAEKPDCMEPWRSEHAVAQDKVAGQFRAMFGRFAGVQESR